MHKKKSKYLITGVLGFVASHFIDYLQAKQDNSEILGLDILPKETLNYNNVNYQAVDLTNRNLIQSILENFKPDYIVHLASISSVSDSWSNPVKSFVNNTNIYLNLVDSIRLLNLKTKILSIGSSEGYGNYNQTQMPLKESYELKPTSPYAVARVSQEMLSKLYADSFNINTVITRSFNHIGPGQNEKFVISSFVKQLVQIKKGLKENILSVGNINITRDFLDVRDVVDAYYKLLNASNLKSGEVYNICSGIPVKLSEIIHIISEILGIAPKIVTDRNKIRPTDNTYVLGDNTKIKNEIRWQPNYSLNQSLNDLINYWNERL